MEDLRLAIIVIGVFCILGILIHGLWTIRKNAAEKNKQKARKEPGLRDSDAGDEKIDFEEPITTDLQTETDPLHEGLSPEFSMSPDLTQEGELSDFDEDGIGQVRTVAKNEVEHEPLFQNHETVAEEPEEAIPEPPSSLLKTDGQEASTASPIKADTSTLPVKESTPAKERISEKEASSTMHSHASAEPVAFSSNESTTSKPTFAEKAKQLVSGEKKERGTPKRVEPSLANDEQIRMEFEQQPKMNLDNSRVENESAHEEVQEEVLVLNVKMPEGKAIAGASLLPALLTLGFKFGEQNVFHRHAASNGKGPKLFSLANMFKPGTFDVDAMETFETQGITLFMILPIEGEPQQVFNMMHNAARKLADEFGGQILDGRRSLLTKQSLQQYVEKIREFERRRMINRS